MVLLKVLATEIEAFNNILLILLLCVGRSPLFRPTTGEVARP